MIKLPLPKKPTLLQKKANVIVKNTYINMRIPVWLKKKLAKEIDNPSQFYHLVFMKYWKQEFERLKNGG